MTVIEKKRKVMVVREEWIALQMIVEMKWDVNEAVSLLM